MQAYSKYLYSISNSRSTRKGFVGPEHSIHLSYLACNMALVGKHCFDDSLAISRGSPKSLELQSCGLQESLPLLLRSFRTVVHTHHPNVHDCRKQRTVGVGQSEFIQQQFRISFLHRDSGISEYLENVFVWPVVERKVEKVHPCA